MPKAWNYLNTLSAGTAARPGAFIDRLASGDADPHEGGGERLCAGERYETVQVDRDHKKLMFRLGGNPQVPWGSIELEKTYQLKRNTLVVTYTLINRGNVPERFCLIPEINLSFPGEGEAFLRVINHLSAGKTMVSGGRGAASDSAGLELQDLQNETIIRLNWEGEQGVRFFPVYGGARGLYQATCIQPVIQAAIEAGKSLRAEVKLSIIH
jgi:hypothetical protein